MAKQNLFDFNLIERTADEVTPRAGLIMFDGFMRAMKIDEIIDRHVPLPGSNSGYKAWTYIRSLCLIQYGGGRHIADLREIREDKALIKATGMKTIPSESGAGDWLLRMGKGEGIKGMGEINREVTKKLLKMDETDGYTMWADPTIIELGDKVNAKMTYLGIRGDRPILIGLKELPIFVHYEYREGNAMGGTAKAVKEGFEVVESSGKRVKHFAGDSEFYNGSLINFVRSKGTTFTIVADKDDAVKEVIKRIPDNEWKPYFDSYGVKTDREIAVTVHTMKETDAFTLVVLRWKKEQLSLFEPEIYSYHAIATDLDIDAKATIRIHKESVSYECKAVWEYNERAQMENLLKELKVGIGMEHMPCGQFEANAMYFGIGVLTYNLMVGQKYFVIKEDMEQKTIATLRWTLLQIPAWIVRHSNRVRLKIAATLEKFNHYLRMIKRMEVIATAPG
ncbi:MAG: IS1380 family transposase [Thermodesulfobacteriota bacterium]